MERRLSARLRVDLPAWSFEQGPEADPQPQVIRRVIRRPCRVVDLSPGGMLVLRDRGASRAHADEEDPEVNGVGAYEVSIPGARPVRARARTVRREGGLYAVKFIVIHDIDRLNIAEAMDRGTKSLLH